VVVPSSWACCARPLFDSGMLDLARATLNRLVNVLDPFLARGLPVVVAEPSCLASIRHELLELLPDDPRAARLARGARSLSEHLVERSMPIGPMAEATGHLAVYPHCHQRATGSPTADRAVLEAAGFSVEVLDAGCCGLAGSFGFHAELDQLSRRVADGGFRPALEALPASTGLVVDGFSCATQAAQLGIGTTKSLAEVLDATLGLDGTGTLAST